METITLPKREYQSLLERAFRYDFLENIVKKKENIFSPPPTRSIKEVMYQIRTEKLYSQAFLNSLEKGLKRSDYFKIEAEK